MTNETTAKRQRSMARQPSSNASETQDAEIADTIASPIRKHSEAKKPNKTDTVLALLNSEGGATLNQLAESTGWLPHSARAALTGLTKKGQPIERTKVEGVSRYAIIGPVSQ